jgi:phosphatidylserine/phosphatidylglycerophosphate/cardiolipin synthase-like enzyme
MEKAEQSILFLMFNPGPANTFFNYVQDLQSRKNDLFIHGIINQDPGASSQNPLIFFHNGQKVETDWDAILPKSVSEAFAFWYKEVSAGLVTIHSKVLVIDPFGEKPYVITGSHNFGPKASKTNDENLLIIQDASLAAQYAVNIMAVYDHYRWRYSLFNQASSFTGLIRDRDWMIDYMSDTVRMKELKFWVL